MFHQRSTESVQDGPGDGLFTEGCFALVEGEYTQNATLEVVAIGQPPCEGRDVARLAAPPSHILEYQSFPGRYMDT